MKKKIIHQYEGCISCGACYSMCPQFFKLNEETYKAELIDGQTPVSPSQNSQPEHERVIEANEIDDSTAELLAASCCASIIQVENI